MKDKAYVVGVGMVPFQKPGKSESYDVMAAAATRAALADAGLDYDKVQQAYVGYVYGDSTSGQRALYHVGMTGIPVLNVNNNCSTGSSALFLARQAVESGAVECALALGFEQMQPGAIVAKLHDRVSPFTSFDAETDVLVGNTEIPLALRYFGGAGKAHMEEFGTTLETFAKIRAKASRHASRNPVALFRQEVTPEEVMAAQVVWPGGERAGRQRGGDGIAPGVQAGAFNSSARLGHEVGQAQTGGRFSFLFLARQVVPVTGHDHMVQRGLGVFPGVQVVPQLGQQVLRRDRHARAAVGHVMGQLVAAVHRVHRHHHRIRPQDGVVAQHPLRAVLQIQQHPVARLHATHVFQVARQARGLVVKRGEAQLGAIVDQEGLVGVAAGRDGGVVKQVGLGQGEVVGQAGRPVGEVSGGFHTAELPPSTAMY